MENELGTLYLEGKALYQYQFFLWLHLLSISIFLLSLGASFLLALSDENMRKKYKKIIFIANGVGLLGTMVSGFGMLMKLAMLSHVGSWVWGKIFIWLILGLVPSTVLIRPKLTLWIAIVTIILLSVALALVFFKPF